MVNNLFVTYSLQDGATTEQEMARAIAKLGTAIRLLPGAWYVNGQLSAGEAAEQLRQGMNAADLLLVVDASNNDFARFGVDCQACESVEELWSR